MRVETGSFLLRIVACLAHGHGTYHLITAMPAGSKPHHFESSMEWQSEPDEKMFD
jgi:hypothetical protein